MFVCPQCNTALGAGRVYCPACKDITKAVPLIPAVTVSAAPWPWVSRSLPQKLVARIEFYKKKIAEEPFNPERYVGLGDLYRDHRYYEEALAQYRKAVNVDPDYMDGHLRSAEVSLRMVRPSTMLL